jgi:hypothetical protein
MTCDAIDKIGKAVADLRSNPVSAAAGYIRHDEFAVGGIFWCSGYKWRCTDIGSRVITAIKLDREDDPSWYNGPPYGVAEGVFDEYDIEGCTREPAPDDGASAAPAPVAGGKSLP